MKVKFLLLLFFVSVLFISSLLVGPIEIKFSDFFLFLSGGEVEDSMALIIREIRIPRTFTALFAGMALGVCGLLMQTYFQNPLAGPFVLGVHSGSSLTIALYTMATSTIVNIMPGWLNNMGITFVAIIGSLVVLLLILILQNYFVNKSFVLIIGLLFGYLSSGLISILVAFSPSYKVKEYLMWNLGSFNRIEFDHLFIFSFTIFFLCFLAFMMAKRLNVFLLGEEYAKSVGVNTKNLKFLIIIICGVASGIVTSFCGPIAFIGILSPHITRKFLTSDNHLILIPSTMTLGGSLALLAEIVINLAENYNITLNALLGLMGAPILIFFIFKNMGLKREWT